VRAAPRAGGGVGRKLAQIRPRAATGSAAHPSGARTGTRGRGRAAGGGRRLRASVTWVRGSRRPVDGARAGWTRDTPPRPRWPPGWWEGHLACLPARVPAPAPRPGSAGAGRGGAAPGRSRARRWVPSLAPGCASPRAAGPGPGHLRSRRPLPASGAAKAAWPQKPCAKTPHPWGARFAPSLSQD
jgi:hypothetical protein